MIWPFMWVGLIAFSFGWPVVMIGFWGLNRERLVCCHKVSMDIQLGERSHKGLSRNQKKTLKALVLLPVVCAHVCMRTYTYVHNRVILSVFCSITLQGYIGAGFKG